MRSCWPSRAWPQAPELQAKLLKLEARPRRHECKFQLLCTLGGISSAASRAAQERLLARNIEDPWMQVAALTRLFGSRAAAFPQRRGIHGQEDGAQDHVLSPGFGGYRRSPQAG